MPEENLINFIKERLAEGFDEKSIREALLETGHLPEEVERAFKALLEKEIPKEPERPKLMEEVLPYQPKEKIPFWKRPPKKILLPLIILVALIFIGGVSALFLPKILKPDPIALLPQETAFYLRVKINPEERQVKNLKENLSKFPYYEKLSQKISEEFEKMKKENPPLKNLDFTISDEIILAWISPFEPEMKEFSLVLFLPDPELKKLEKLAKDVQEEIKKSKDWKLETERYKGREIFKAIPTKESKFKPLAGEPKLEPSTTFTNGHFILASKPEDIKKIIDVAEDQEITKVFKKDKIKSIESGVAYRKIKKYFPKDYLSLFYGQFDWSKILKIAERTETVKKTEKFFPPLTASLRAALELPFFKKKEIEEPEKVALAGVIIAEKNQLKFENYFLDKREDAFWPDKFSFKESLANFLPEKIGNQEIAYYKERRNLKKSFDHFEKTLTREIPGMTEQQRKLPELQREILDEFFRNLKIVTEVDLKEDIIPLFEENYAISIYSEATGKERPVISFIFEVDDENRAKENLLKIKIPKIPTIKESLEQSRLRAQDTKIIANILQIRTTAEMIYLKQKSYKNVSCFYKELKPICQDINKQIGGWYPIIHQSRDNYCAYTKLNEPGAYYCIDSTGVATQTDINPGEGYCTKRAFGCPKITGPLFPEEKPPERVSFSKETVDGFEIYSLPFFENFGLNFSIKDRKLVFTFTKEGLVNVLKSLADQRKLKDSQIFATEFKKIPKEINSISYTYPYGFLGMAKALVNSFVNYLAAFAPPEELEAGPSPEFIISTVNEFLDRGVAPYLKVLKTASSYSYSPEKGLNISKGKLVIEELPTEEKRRTEEFWQNIGKWFEEKFGPLFSPVPGPPLLPGLTPLPIY